MEKTKEIHKALKRRKFLHQEINDIEDTIDRLSKKVNGYKNECKVLDFELRNWDIFYNKTNS